MRFGARQAITALCNKRLGFLRGLKIFWRFGKGWTTRVEAVRSAALAMARP
jgi:lysozyme family protein